MWLTLHTAQAPRSIRVGVADLLSKLFGFPVDADGLIAETKAFVGAANIAAGSFQGFPVSTSGSRAAVAAHNGAKTQVTGLVERRDPADAAVRSGAAARNLPQHPPLRGGDRRVAVAGRPDRDAATMAAKRRTDFALAMTAFLGVALLRGAARHRARGRGADPGRVQPAWRSHHPGKCPGPTKRDIRQPCGPPLDGGDRKSSSCCGFLMRNLRRAMFHGADSGSDVERGLRCFGGPYR